MMTQRQVAQLVNEMYQKYPRVDGWVFNYEYPGFFQFTKNNVSFCFTPDWGKDGEVCIQVFRGPAGEAYVDGWDIPYSGALGADELMSLIRARLLECEQWTN